MINAAIKELTERGYKIGLEAQSDINVKYYEKLGFETIGTAQSRIGGVLHRYMVYKEPDKA